MDFRVGKRLKTQRVQKVIFRPDLTPLTFPLKELYDKANFTVEGLSVPFPEVAQVEPQGIDTALEEGTSIQPLGAPNADHPEASEDSREEARPHQNPAHPLDDEILGMIPDGQDKSDKKKRHTHTCTKSPA